jgi:hypothetical protein
MINNLQPQKNEARSKTSKKSKRRILELVLVLPIVTIFSLAMFEVGRILIFHTALASASHAAAKYGAAEELDGDRTLANFVDCEGIRVAAQHVTDAFLIPEDAIVTIQFDRGSGTAFYASCAPDPAQVQPGDRVVVHIAATYEPILPLGFRAFDVISEARQVIEGLDAVDGSYGMIHRPQK